MADTISNALVMVADTDLRIVRVNNVVLKHDNDATLPYGLDSLNLLDHIDGISRDEAMDVCERIMAGMRFKGGARSYKKITATAEMPGEHYVVLLGPRYDSNNDVDGIVYAKFLSTKADGISQHDLGPEKFYEYLVKRSTDLVFLADAQCQIIFANESVQRFTGFSAKAILGKHISEIVHPDDVNMCRSILGNAITSGVPVPDFQCRLISIDDSVRSIILSAVLLETENGLRLLGTCKDITESVMLRESLMVRNKVLSSLNRIVTNVSSARALDEGLKTMLEMVLEALDMRKGLIAIAESDDLASIRVQSGFDNDVDLNGRVFRIASLCFESGVVGVGRCNKDDCFDIESQRIFEDENIDALVKMLMTGGGIVNAVMLLAVTPGVEMSVEQKEFISLAPGMLGPAIENLRLYEVERTKSLELEALAREAHHRIKNNLQMITGLLNIAARDHCEGPSYARCARQIRAVATVHDLLSPKTKASKLQLLECVTIVAEQAIMGMGCGDRIRLVSEGDECWITPDFATALGIIANEIVCNAAEHAFGNDGVGVISIRVWRDGLRTFLRINDNGVGLPEGFEVPQRPDSGLGLVTTLAKHGLGGRLKVESAERGTSVDVVF